MHKSTHNNMDMKDSNNNLNSIICCFFTPVKNESNGKEANIDQIESKNLLNDTKKSNGNWIN